MNQDKSINKQNDCRPLKQDAIDAANENIKNCHTPKQEANSSVKTIKLNTCMAAARYQPTRHAEEQHLSRKAHFVQPVHFKIANEADICRVLF